MIVEVITNEIFKIPLLVLISKDDDACIEEIMKRLDETIDKEEIDLIVKDIKSPHNATTYCLSNHTIFVRFRKTSNGIIAHESFHIVDFIMQLVGIKLCSESCEAYAYNIDFYVETIHSIIEENEKQKITNENSI